MACRLCPECLTAFPPEREFDRCPDCRCRTHHFATSAAAFEAYYGKHETARERRGDPSPEALGRMEAHELLVNKHRAEIDQLEASA